jgi:ABC-type glycerol-3-phosphate transport system substrate-binding protein
MSGTAPVLIYGMFVDYLDPRVAMYLEDWLPVIKAAPDFSEDDWFMNVFHSESVHGKLYAFPNSFVYRNVSVNDTVPGLRDALSERENITMPELIALHNEFAAGTSYLIDSNFDASWLINYDLHSFLDFESGWVDFDNERFIRLITDYRALTSPNKEFGTITSSNIVFRDQEIEWSEKYLFNITYPGTIQYYIDFKTGPLFFEHIPLVNERGELITVAWDNYVLNANATPVEHALAWEFIKFINDTDNRGAMSINGLQQTNRNVFRNVAEAVISGTGAIIGTVEHLRDHGWQTVLSEDETMQNTITLLESYGDMPMARSANIPEAIFDTIYDALKLFHEGLVSAEQTAADLQNRVELMLMEMDR